MRWSNYSSIVVLVDEVYQKASEEDYLLKGWVVCDECGQNLTSNGKGSRGSTKRYHYYYCRNGLCKNYKKGMPPHVVHQDFEALLMTIRCHSETLKACEYLVKDLWKSRLRLRKRSAEKAKQKLMYVESQMDDCIKQLTRHEEDFIVNHIKKKLNELNAEKVVLEVEANQKPENDYDMEELIWRVNALLSDPFLLWRRALLKDKRAMLNLLFPEKLRYKRGEGFRKAGDPLICGENNAFNMPISGLVELNGVEPLTSSMPWKRSTS